MGELYKDPFEPVELHSRFFCDLNSLSRSLRAAYLSSDGTREPFVLLPLFRLLLGLPFIVLRLLLRLPLREPLREEPFMLAEPFCCVVFQPFAVANEGAIGIPERN